MVDLNITKRNSVNRDNERLHGCTIFTVSYGEKVFFGNNLINKNGFEMIVRKDEGIKRRY